MFELGFTLLGNVVLKTLKCPQGSSNLSLSHTSLRKNLFYITENMRQWYTCTNRVENPQSMNCSGCFQSAFWSSYSFVLNDFIKILARKRPFLVMNISGMIAQRSKDNALSFHSKVIRIFNESLEWQVVMTKRWTSNESTRFLSF